MEEVSFRFGMVIFYVLRMLKLCCVSCQVHSEPPEARVRSAYSEPYISYNGHERADDYGPRSHYDEDDYRDARLGFDERVDRQAIGYKPSGNIVK